MMDRAALDFVMDERDALRREIQRLEVMLEGVVAASERVREELGELRMFVAAHTRLEQGITDFDLHHQVVEAFPNDHPSCQRYGP